MKVDCLHWFTCAVFLILTAGIQTARGGFVSVNGGKPRLVPTLGPADAVNAASFSRDGKLLATGSSDGVAILWDVATGNEVRRMIVTSGQVVQVQFFADDHKLLTGTSDGR